MNMQPSKCINPSENNLEHIFRIKLYCILSIFPLEMQCCMCYLKFHAIQFLSAENEKCILISKIISDAIKSKHKKWHPYIMFL